MKKLLLLVLFTSVFVAPMVSACENGNSKNTPYVDPVELSYPQRLGRLFALGLVGGVIPALGEVSVVAPLVYMPFMAIQPLLGEYNVFPTKNMPADSSWKARFIESFKNVGVLATVSAGALCGVTVRNALLEQAARYLASYLK